ncbi:MAG TPA: nuclear transport factor 2 family protein [Pseudonocardia sp.]|jgi:ketosteroid isomerase-like protein
MSDTDVKEIERFLELVQAGDIHGAVMQMTEDVVVEEMGSIPHSGTYHGREGFLALITRFGELYGGFALSDVSVHDAGSFVVARMTGTFTSKDGSKRAIMPVTEHYTMRDHKMAHADVYYKDPDQFKSFDYR